MKDKIAFYIPQMHCGGAERVVSRLTVLLGERYDVTVIVNEEAVEFELFCEIITLKIPASNSRLWKGVNLLKRSWRLRTLKKKYKWNCVISFLSSANLVNILARTKSSKTVVSFRSFVIEGYTGGRSISKSLLRILYNRADGIITVSKEIEQKLSEQLGVKKEKIITIYNPFDMTAIQLEAEEELIKEEVDYFESNKVFLTIGRFEHAKGYWHLAKAISLLKTVEVSNVKFGIIGSGGSDQDKLVRLINELGIEDKVVLLGYKKNPLKYLKMATGYILSSVIEGFPNALVEAMACGCAVIAADCRSGPREILFEDFDSIKNDNGVIQYGDYGILTPELSAQENWEPGQIEIEERILAEAIEEVILDNELREKYKNLSMNRAKNYAYGQCLDKYEQLFVNLYNGKPLKSEVK